MDKRCLKDLESKEHFFRFTIPMAQKISFLQNVSAIYCHLLKTAVHRKRNGLQQIIQQNVPNQIFQFQTAFSRKLFKLDPKLVKSKSLFDRYTLLMVDFNFGKSSKKRILLVKVNL